ncbi:MAG: adenosine deaminase [Ardenticatenaceae bacterium]|nr:adenosine deaminase [Ardenticatenaceae bacterium]
MDATQLESLRRWPKVELHRHLEGTLNVQTAWALARAAGAVEADEPLASFARRVQWDPTDPPHFEEFLGKFNFLRQFYTSREAIERVAREAVAQAAAEQIRYLELRFNPDHFAEAAGLPQAEVASWILAAATGEASAHPITVRFLITINRNRPLAAAEEALAAALANLGTGIVGLDLAGNEAGPEPDGLTALFHEAAAAGLGITVHAGEVGPPTNVWYALDHFRADRIGHGIQSIHDPALVAMLAERGIALEVCPTSNLQTGAISRLDEHPLGALHRAGVPVTLNSDDPGISQTTLTGEYALALTDLGLTPADLRDLILTAVDHAFLPAPEQAALRAELARALAPAIESLEEAS